MSRPSGLILGVSYLFCPNFSPLCSCIIWDIASILSFNSSFVYFNFSNPNFFSCALFFLKHPVCVVLRHIFLSCSGYTNINYIYIYYKKNFLFFYSSVPYIISVSSVIFIFPSCWPFGRADIQFSHRSLCSVGVSSMVKCRSGYMGGTLLFRVNEWAGEGASRCVTELGLTLGHQPPH